MPDFPLLQTPRLLLREITEADAEDLFRIHSDARHMAWFGSDPLTDLSEAKRLIATFASWRQLPNPGVRWGLQLKGQQPDLVGSCGLFAWNRGWKSEVQLGLRGGARGGGPGPDARSADGGTRLGFRRGHATSPGGGPGPRRQRGLGRPAAAPGLCPGGPPARSRVLGRTPPRSAAVRFAGAGVARQQRPGPGRALI